MRTWCKRLWIAAGVSTVGGCALLAADAATYGRVTRNLRCLAAAVETVYHFKVEFDEEKQDITHEKVAKLWHGVCASNAGMYIKLAQSIASMNHVLPVQYQRELGKLQDKAPFVPFAQIERVLREDLGSNWRHHFQAFDEEPVASASIAQVHRAVLQDGSPVAVKVQKPEIAKQLGWDLFCYRVIVWAFEKAFGLPLYWTVDTTVSTIMKEANFETEARNGERAGEDIRRARLEKIAAVPKIYWEATTKRVMTAEWIDGVKISDGPGLHRLGLSVPKVVESMVEVFASQIFLAGFVHCDPHPGNVLVRQLPPPPGKQPAKGKHQIVVLDHGMYIELPPQFRRDYSRLWKAMVLMDTPTLTQIAEGWGFGDPAFFASIQMFKPYKPENGAIHLENTTVSDMQQMHTSAKDKIRQLLLDTEHTPRELFLIGRNMNLVRANNKHHGSPVNRINIMARYAAMGVTLDHHPHHHHRPDHNEDGGGGEQGDDRFHTGTVNDEGEEMSLASRVRQQWELLVFNLRLWAISLAYHAAQVWRSVWVFFGYKDVGGFEDQLEKVAVLTIEEQFGIKINMNIQEDGKGFG